MRAGFGPRSWTSWRVLGVGPVSGEESGEDRILSHWDDGPRVLRIEAREDLVCARQATELLGPG